MADGPQPYQPCNGDETVWFVGKWCDPCRKDKHCTVIAWMMGTAIGDPKYPTCLVRDESGAPTCTRFAPKLPRKPRKKKSPAPHPDQGDLQL